MISKQEMQFAQFQAMNDIMAQVSGGTNSGAFQEAFLRMVSPERDTATENLRRSLVKSAAGASAYARMWREGGQASGRSFQSRAREAAKAMAKAGPLDIGTNVNFSQISGGQSLGYVSLDTQLARGTIRPDTFALYQALPKTAAFQVVDFWAYSDDIGGNLPGTNFTGFANVASGSLITSAGLYNLQSVTLKLSANGRALTTALAAQNSFVDIAAQENANAALSVLQDFDWGCFWGNPTLYPNQPAGIASTIPSGNAQNFQTYATESQNAGLSNDQILFNLIYDVAAQTTKYGRFGHITHAFMSQSVISSLQSLTTTLLNNVVNVNSFAIRTGGDRNLQGMTVNGDIDGMHTRFGQIRFPVDILLNSRNTPAQAYVYSNGSSPATATSPTPPTGVVVAASGGVLSGSQWTSAYTANSGTYVYAVASTNGQMLESNLTYSAVVTGVTTGGAYTVTMAPPAAGDATVFRVYRSGLLYNLTGTGNNPASFRYIGSVAASGSANVSFVDANTSIPGSETIFLLDMDENDRAIDFRFLLPLTKIELFAQNLYMPWAVAMIGSPRLRVPKYHAMIQNFIPDNPNFNPLLPNLSAQAG